MQAKKRKRRQALLVPPTGRDEQNTTPRMANGEESYVD
jgi:hypothetical protein